MNALMDEQWLEGNQRYLSQELSRIQLLLKKHAEKNGIDVSQLKEEKIENKVEQVVADDSGQQTFTFPLDKLCQIFALSNFERDILLLCAGMELQSSFATYCAVAYGESHKEYPTFGLALTIFDNAHWSALTPNSPLRYWRLIDVRPGETLTTSAIRIDERILHFIAGVQHLDEQLTGFVKPIVFDSETLVPSQQCLAETIATLWSNSSRSYPVIQLIGNDVVEKRKVAMTAAKTIGFNLHLLDADVLPPSPVELDALIRLWEREAVLANSALLLDCEALDNLDYVKKNMVNHFLEEMRDVLVVLTPQPLKTKYRNTVAYDINKPTKSEQIIIWEKNLGDVASKMNGQLQYLVSQFDLSTQEITAISNETLTGTKRLSDIVELAEKLWARCRSQVRPKVENLAQRIEALATWEDLVLPQRQLDTLRYIAKHVRQRTKVYDLWGFRKMSVRGLGISALFAGVSGTGKTMAAEVLANELGLDLYRIDLSQVVSKYIGETEKNLSKVFDAAEDAAAILLFDEADALFGKRTEVKDSHDRYANIEVSYLLQRMEAYKGLAILTTNLKDAIDDAFTRRLRFVVTFPFPNSDAREEIWNRIFPENTPVDHLSIKKLARLNVPGGNIRNIAINAAFLAADSGEPVRMGHILQAARNEYAKLEKPLSETELRGWK